MIGAHLSNQMVVNGIAACSYSIGIVSSNGTSRAADIKSKGSLIIVV
jgi:hypothetical protein